MDGTKVGEWKGNSGHKESPLSELLCFLQAQTQLKMDKGKGNQEPFVFNSPDFPKCKMSFILKPIFEPKSDQQV